jgi:crotonobetaine/carnitine-CoA ligase
MQDSTVPLLRRLIGGDDSTVTEVFLARCAASAGHLFVRTDHGTWSYAQALKESERIAAYLELIFAGGGSRHVAVLLHNSVYDLWAWFGASLAGGVHCALDTAQRGALRAAHLSRVRAQVLVTEDRILESFGSELHEAGIRHVLLVGGHENPQTPALDGILVTHVADLPRPRLRAWPRREPGDVAALLYTSGTTGTSKLVALPHNLLARGGARLAQSLSLDHTDVFHHWMPRHHIGGQLHGVMSTIIGGGALAMFPAFSTSEFLRQAREARATVFIGFANVLEYLLSTAAAESDQDHHLRIGIIAGGNPTLRRRFETRFGVTLVDSYGMTEAEPLTLPAKTPPGSAGAVNPDFEVVVLDDSDRIAAIGATGVIAFRPRVPHVMMLEYHGDATATVVAWRNLWFHTSDIGRMDASGNLYILDRMQNAIRRRGENIASCDIESVLLLHPAIRACAVVGVPVEADVNIKAIIVLYPGATLESANIRAYCESNMAKFMVPQIFEYRDSLPYTAMGKLDRARL